MDQQVEIPPKLNEYFSSLRLKEINLSQEQKNWYSIKKMIQKDDMLREYPSIPEEAFLHQQRAVIMLKRLLKLSKREE